jgi:hypothetical protein
MEEWLIVRRGTMYNSQLRREQPFSNRIKFFDEISAREYLEWLVGNFNLKGAFSLYEKTKEGYETR